MPNNDKPKSKVFLKAYANDGRIVEHLEISYSKFYDGTNPVVDSNAFRSEHGIRKLAGEVYDSAGDLQQTFENLYSDDGRFEKGRIVHCDGSTSEI